MSRNRQRQQSTGSVLTSSKSYGQIHRITKLGSGGFSDVYLSYSTLKDQLLACKRIKRNSRLSTARFASELETFNITKNCPYLVTFFDCTYDNDFVYFLSELVYGGTLNTKNNNFTNNDRSQIANQLCQALFFLHYRQIAHLDVKPENILVVQEDPVYIKLHDYGISKNEDSMNVDSYLGTPLYMAPEMLLKAKNLDYYKCDSFSTGLVLFELYSKRLPITHQNVNSLEKLVSRYINLNSMEKLSVSEFKSDSPSSLSNMINFINGLLLKNPEARYEVTKIFNFLPAQPDPAKSPNYQQFFTKNFKNSSTYFQYLKLKFSHDPVTTERLDNISQAHTLAQDWNYQQALELYTKNFAGLLATAKNVSCDELRAAFKEFLKIAMGEAETLKKVVNNSNSTQTNRNNDITSSKPKSSSECTIS